MTTYNNPDFFRDHLRGNAVISVSYLDTMCEVAKWGNEFWQRVRYNLTAEELPENKVRRRFIRLDQC